MGNPSINGWELGAALFQETSNYDLPVKKSDFPVHKAWELKRRYESWDLGFPQFLTNPHFFGILYFFFIQCFEWFLILLVSFIPSHMLHGAGIFANICPKNQPVLYTSTMEQHMGYLSSHDLFFWAGFAPSALGPADTGPRQLFPKHLCAPPVTMTVVCDGHRRLRGSWKSPMVRPGKHGILETWANGNGQFLVGGAITILKNMSSSMGRMTSHI